MNEVNLWLSLSSFKGLNQSQTGGKDKITGEVTRDNYKTEQLMVVVVVVVGRNTESKGKPHQWQGRADCPEIKVYTIYVMCKYRGCTVCTGKLGRTESFLGLTASGLY